MIFNRRIVRLAPGHIIKPFDCGNADLNEFLFHDAEDYGRRLLAVTYLLEDDVDLLAYFSVSNDRISINEYQHNGFKFLMPSDLNNKEKETVSMYYDLTQLLP